MVVIKAHEGGERGCNNQNRRWKQTAALFVSSPVDFAGSSNEEEKEHNPGLFSCDFRASMLETDVEEDKKAEEDERPRCSVHLFFFFSGLQGITKKEKSWGTGKEVM